MRTTKASSSILCGSALERAPPLSRSIILNYPKKAVLTGVPIGAPRDAGMRQYRHTNQCLSFREAWPHSDADLTLIDNSPSRRPQHPSIVAGRRFSQSSIGRVVPLLKVSAQSDAVSSDRQITLLTSSHYFASRM